MINSRSQSTRTGKIKNEGKRLTRAQSGPRRPTLLSACSSRYCVIYEMHLGKDTHIDLYLLVFCKECLCYKMKSMSIMSCFSVMLVFAIHFSVLKLMSCQFPNMAVTYVVPDLQQGWGRREAHQPGPFSALERLQYTECWVCCQPGHLQDLLSPHTCGYRGGFGVLCRSFKEQ